MKGADCISFVIRILAFLTTYYFMIDYLFICNISTKIGSSVAVIGIIAITIAYYPLRGKYLSLCDKCDHRSGFKSKK